ncbi:hypothetical protein A6X21_15745 [Planctopirus hydrillae]|uniref:Uncharacterized protein n=1 Tax=Planctopirus hydrillae TaxID=1841610 RepID=A0A1C3ETV4_9PLAN|nr:hypothetical protein A6X21_15745 [Planctopirus hydrillae]
MSYQSSSWGNTSFDHIFEVLAGNSSKFHVLSINWIYRQSVQNKTVRQPGLSNGLEEESIVF